MAFPRTGSEGAVSIDIFMPPMIFMGRPLPRGGRLCGLGRRQHPGEYCPDASMTLVKCPLRNCQLVLQSLQLRHNRTRGGDQP